MDAGPQDIDGGGIDLGDQVTFLRARWALLAHNVPTR